MCRWHSVRVCLFGHSDESEAPVQRDGLCPLSAEVQELRSALRRLASRVMWHARERISARTSGTSPDPLKKVSTEVQTEEKKLQEQYEEFMIESPESRTNKVKESTALKDSEGTLGSSITDNESEFQSAQSSAAEEKNSAGTVREVHD